MGYGSKTFGYFEEDEEDFFNRRRGAKMTPKISEPWNPSIAEHFKKLENLEELLFRFGILKENPVTWAVDIMTALPSLEKLRDIRIMTDSAPKLSGEEKKITNAIEQLRNVRKIDLSSCAFSDETKKNREKK